jgi:hypothetical protein
MNPRGVAAESTWDTTVDEVVRDEETENKVKIQNHSTLQHEGGVQHVLLTAPGIERILFSSSPGVALSTASTQLTGIVLHVGDNQKRPEVDGSLAAQLELVFSRTSRKRHYDEWLELAGCRGRLLGQSSVCGKPCSFAVTMK